MITERDDSETDNEIEIVLTLVAQQLARIDPQAGNSLVASIETELRKRDRRGAHAPVLSRVLARLKS